MLEQHSPEQTNVEPLVALLGAFGNMGADKLDWHSFRVYHTHGINNYLMH